MDDINARIAAASDKLANLRSMNQAWIDQYDKAPDGSQAKSDALAGMESLSAEIRLTEQLLSELADQWVEEQ